MFSTFSKRTVAERPDFQSASSAMAKYDTSSVLDVGGNIKYFLQSTMLYACLISLSIVEYSKILRVPVAPIYYFGVRLMSVV